MTDYFFDTYAIIEILNGNPAYDSYADANFVFTKLNFFELYYHLLKTQETATATYFLQNYAPFIADFDERVVILAAEFRFAYKKQDLSMTDCIGYILAQQLGIPFLTGDNKFADKPGVKFVK